MKCYIATKFDNQRAFHEMRALLEGNGHSLTVDWTKHDKPEAGEDMLAFKERCAFTDYVGVDRADVLILLVVPDMAAAFSELGIALARRRTIIVVGYREGKDRDNVFYYHPCVLHAKTMEDAANMLGIAAPAEVDNSRQA